MDEFSAKIYELIIFFTEPGEYVEKLCRDMGVVPEHSGDINKDDWAISGVLEIWFQEILPDKIKLHMQKAHFKHDKTYISQLEQFYRNMMQLKYIDSVQFL